jgi:hypothetical protein
MTMLGLDIIGADSSGIEMLVKSVNTAAYAANLMARDGGIANVGDSDPAFTLQPGAHVTAAGPPAKNKTGVAYISVTAPGKDGLFWIRASSLSEVVPGSASSPVAASGPSWLTLPAWVGGPERWKVGVIGAVGTVALALVIWGFSGPKPHWRRHGHAQ